MGNVFSEQVQKIFDDTMTYYYNCSSVEEIPIEIVQFFYKLERAKNNENNL